MARQRSAATKGMLHSMLDVWSVSWIWLTENSNLLLETLDIPVTTSVRV